MYDDPLRRLFRNLKSSAIRRKIEFALDFPYFKKIAIEQGYDTGHGNGTHDLTVDRDEGFAGYVPGNITIITRAMNSRKSWIEKTGWSWRDKI